MSNFKYQSMAFEIKVAILFLVAMSETILICGQFDLAWDQRLMQIKKEYKCGVTQSYDHIAKPRVINGKETSDKKYPWLAQIVLFLQIPPEHKTVVNDFYLSGGSIISEKAILTCAHCTCFSESNWKEDLKNVVGNKDSIITVLPKCLEDMSGQAQNQNRPDNQIFYSIPSSVPFITRGKIFNADPVRGEIMFNGETKGQ